MTLNPFDYEDLEKMKCPDCDMLICHCPALCDEEVVEYSEDED